VIQQAMVHAAVSSAKHVDSGSLLVFMLQEEKVTPPSSSRNRVSTA